MGLISQPFLSSIPSYALPGRLRGFFLQTTQAKWSYIVIENIVVFEVDGYWFVSWLNAFCWMIMGPFKEEPDAEQFALFLMEEENA